MEVIWDILAWIGACWLLTEAYSHTVAWLRSRRKRPESQEEVLRAWHRRHPNIPPLEGCRYCQEASPPSSPATETTAETPPGNGAG